MTASGRAKHPDDVPTKPTQDAPPRSRRRPRSGHGYEVTPLATPAANGRDDAAPTADGRARPTVTRRRLDAELVRRGLAAAAAEAQEAVRAGLVPGGRRARDQGGHARRPTTPRSSSAGPARRSSRGGREARRRARPVRRSTPPACACLDAGASTGGFTDCLLRGGARARVAVDVGYGQLAWHAPHRRPRVTVLERTNVRELHPGDLPYRPGPRGRRPVVHLAAARAARARVGVAVRRRRRPAREAAVRGGSGRGRHAAAWSATRRSGAGSSIEVTTAASCGASG